MSERSRRQQRRRERGSYSAGLILFLLVGLPSALGAQDARETLFWESVECDREAEVRVYLEVYPTGAYVAEAQACLEEQLGLDRAAHILVQRGLAALDYSPGPADGLFGGATRAAVRQWQRAKGEPATGYLTRAQADALVAAGRDAEAERQRQAAAEQRRKAEEERRRQAEVAKRQAQPQELRNSLGMEFVLIEPGTFEMGSPLGEDGRDEDETLYRVTLSRPFYLGKYEVTRGEFGRFVAATGYETGTTCRTYESGEWGGRRGLNWQNPGYQQTETDPVVCVSWVDA